MDLKQHSVFNRPDEPDWVNNGFKWWGIKTDAPKGVQAAYVELPNGDANYVLMDSKGVFYETKNFEALATRAVAEKVIRR